MMDNIYKYMLMMHDQTKKEVGGGIGGGAGAVEVSLTFIASCQLKVS